MRRTLQIGYQLIYLFVSVFHGHYIDGAFTPPFYKMLLNKPITLDDIKAVDTDLNRSLCWML